MRLDHWEGDQNDKSPSLAASFTFCFLDAMMRAVSSGCFHHYLPALESPNYGLQMGAKLNLFSFKLWVLSLVFQQWENDEDTWVNSFLKDFLITKCFVGM